MAENLPENNVKYITGVLKSLRENLSDAKELNPENIELIRRDYEQASKEANDLSGYLDNIRFTYGAQIKSYDDDLIKISVDLGNLNKNLIEYESPLEVEVDSSGTSFGGDPEPAKSDQESESQPEEPSSTNMGSSSSSYTSSGNNPSLPVEEDQSPNVDSDKSTEYSSNKGIFNWFRKKPVKRILGPIVAVAILYGGIKSCLGSSNNEPNIKPGKQVTSDKKEGDKPYTPSTESNCRYDGQFAFDSTRIVNGRKGLEQVIKHLPRNAPIYITASSSVDGEDGYNLILSQDRAKAIKEEINSIDKEKGINIKGDQGVGETDQFSRRYPLNRRFVVSTKPLNKDNLSENAPAIGQATDGCDVTIKPEPYNPRGGKHKKHGKDITDKNPIPEPDEPINDGGNDQPPIEPPVKSEEPFNSDKHTFNHLPFEDLDKNLPKYDGKNAGKNPNDNNPYQPPTILIGDIEDGPDKINYFAVEGEVPTVDYTHSDKSVADDNGDFLVLEKKKELQDINLKKKSTDKIDENTTKDSYVGEEPIQKLKDKDEKGDDIDYKGKIIINVEPQSLNLENNTTLLGALFDYIVPSADAAMIDNHTYAEIKKWDIDIKEKKDEVKKEDIGLEKMIKQNLVADVSY